MLFYVFYFWDMIIQKYQNCYIESATDFNVYSPSDARFETLEVRLVEYCFFIMSTQDIYTKRRSNLLYVSTNNFILYYQCYAHAAMLDIAASFITS
jgi:hypothetical protein